MAPKRAPSVLVTDARERPPSRGSSGHRRSGSASASASSQSDANGSDASSSTSGQRRLPMRHVSVDHVLQNASEIPSGQPRGPPGSMSMLPASATSALSAAASAARRRGLTRRSSSSGAVGPMGAGSGISTGVLLPGAGGVGSRGAVLPAVPSRTSKISEKLVLIPETGKSKSDEDDDEDDDDDEEDANGIDDDDDIAVDAVHYVKNTGDDDDDRIEGDREAAWAASLAGDENAEAARKALQRAQLLARRALEEGALSDGTPIPGSSSSIYDGVRPPRDEELDVLRKRRGIRGKSYAERLPKGQRTEKVARLTAYCTAQAFKMQATAEFLRKRHAAKTKMYDDCLYTVYHLPLLPGHEGYRVRSRPMVTTPGTGKTVLDLEIERSERRDEHMGFYANSPGNKDVAGNSSHDHNGQQMGGDQANGHHMAADEQPQTPPTTQQLYSMSASSPGGPDSIVSANLPLSMGANSVTMSPVNRLAPEAKHFAELFVFSYGVVVFWNFTEHQEKDILADLSFATDETTPTKKGLASKGEAVVSGDAVHKPSTGGQSLVTRPLDEAEFETEEFHFEYSASVQRPRVFNDMITLLPRSDHMVKLTISHAIAQSTKLCFFEEKMSETMQNAQHVPKQLALTGELNMSRTEIVKILGRLFKNRVDINLSSNILDVPNFFWDAEPTLHPLYVAIREYLEIDQRIQVLNERCRVFLDLAEILANNVADAKMSYITWIIIILIVLSILVTVTEVALRFAILEKEKSKSDRLVNGSAPAPYLLDAPAVPMARIHGTPQQKYSAGEDLSLAELRAWAAQLDARDRAAVCGGDIIGQTYAGV
ncbi:sad1-interacting factor 3 [Ophiostoma piceae UAMH 11346]|uniref:Sad1-interacting factor 3 n=1 Tax=Ophiostoma piceae (strain UAMH 11346) TaxID=1262450 RepID=S3BQD8_OPHP1|nr:sad1-interacting factor 3 [Ophiostoma piceae UAMH 11346]